MEIEHFLPKSRYPEERNRYTNCFHSCRYCNRARRAVENVDLEGNRLLNPCTDVWRDSFELVDDRLVPLTGNGDAEYTCDTYKLNEPTKVTLRKKRRETIDERLELADREYVLALHEDLMNEAVRTSNLRLEEAAEKLWQAHLNAKKDLRQFRAEAWDADRTCRCGRPEGHSIQDVLDEQTLEVDLD